MIEARVDAWRIEAELGAGGMGTVYRAATEEAYGELAPGDKVALKILHPHLLLNEASVGRFLREADVGRRIRHAGVVRIFAAGTATVDGQRRRYLVMELVEGQTLLEVARDLDRVPEELCRYFGRAVAGSLRAIHAVGVVHRDLKPENILVTRDHQVKVMDLGSAVLQDDTARLTRAGLFTGSVGYAAPEQFQIEGGEVDGRADLHALGVILYELSTGRHPFGRGTVQEMLLRVVDHVPPKAGTLNPQISPFFEELLAVLLEKQPNRRFQSASELLRVLQEGEASDWWKERGQLLGATARRPLRRVRRAHETKFVGREEELAELETLCAGAAEGRGRILLLEGEDGVGKTRLTDEFADRIQRKAPEVAFLLGAHAPGGGGQALRPFAEALRRHLPPGDVEEALSGVLEATPLLVPALAAYLQGMPPPAGAEPLTRDSLSTVLIQGLQALASVQPVVLLVEDLHYSGPEGWAAFSQIGLGLSDQRVLLVGTTLPGAAPAWIADLEREGHLARLLLERLPSPEVERLLAEALHAPALASDLLPRIDARTGGNPRFILDVVRSLRVSGALARRPDGRWEATRAIEEVAEPASLRGLLEERLAAVDAHDRDALEVAACWGNGFEPGIVAEVLGRPELEILRALGRLEREHRLVHSLGAHLVFDHPSAPDVLQSMLPAPLRSGYHAAIAQVLERRQQATERPPDAIDGDLCVRLAEHSLSGGRGRHALRYLDRALDHLALRHESDRAVRLVDRALATPGLLDGADRATILLWRVEGLDVLARREDQREALEQAEDALRGIDRPDLLMRVIRGRAILHGRFAEYEESRRHLRRLLDLSMAAGDVRVEISARGGLGIVCKHVGETEQALRYQQECLELARREGLKRDEVMAIGNVGDALLDLGRAEEARAFGARRLALAEEMGDRRGQAIAGVNMACVLADMGDLRQAASLLQKPLRLAGEIGDRRTGAVARCNLGSALRRLGRTGEAREHVEHALDTALVMRERWVEGWTRHVLGEVCWQEGDGDGARHAFDQALHIRRAIGSRGDVAMTLLALARLQIDLGLSEAAQTLLDEAIELARELGVHGILVVATARKLLAGRVTRSEAEGVLEEFGSRLGADERLEAHLLLARATGDRTHHERARTVLSAILGHAPPDDRTRMIREVPLYREAASVLGIERAAK